MEESSDRRRDKPFSEEANEALVDIVSTRWEDLTRGGHRKPPPRAYRRIWVEIADVVTSESNEARTLDQCCKRWNSLLAAARKKISINQREQCRTGGGSAMFHALSGYEELAVALVGPESRSVTTRGVAEPTLDSRQVSVVSMDTSTTPEPS
uniref:myb-related transcription factor, partner of profilin-like n=1 Tax=Pristiophorus japonicus TaxID=55135 RepID=UPI00398E9F48